MKVYDKFKIEQWDGNTGNLIEDYPSIQSAAYRLKMSPNTIRGSIKSSKSDYKGYYWRKKA